MNTEIASSTEHLTLFELVRKGTKLTPMMQQYYEIKQQYPDTLLLFRMGDFYEVFFEDAHQAAHLLNIAKTHRGKLGQTPIPMAGIPHHAASSYINRLTNLGHKVAICEQVEDPKVAKGIVKRAVTQVVSPGLPYDLEKTNERENQYIAAALYNPQNQTFYLAMADFTTGKLFGVEVQDEMALKEALHLYHPKEFLLYPEQWSSFAHIKEYIQANHTLTTTLQEGHFKEHFNAVYIEKFIPAYRRDQILQMTPAIIGPVGALCYYICSTQSLEKVSHFRSFHMEHSQSFLRVTYSTLVGLEIIPSDKRKYQDSLIGFMDKTITSMGTRRMRELFQRPLLKDKEIKERQQVVEMLIHQKDEKLDKIRMQLKDVRDLERILAKVSTKKCNASDLINLALGIRSFKKLQPIIQELKAATLNLLQANQITTLEELANTIERTINDEIGASLDKGNLIKKGIHQQRDRLASLSENAGIEMLKLEKKYREQTGITNLKIKSNNVAGFFIEISKSHLKKVPKTFQRKQTLTNSERYLSEDLIELEKEIISAKEKLHALERTLFGQIIAQVESLCSSISTLAQVLATIDFFQSLAWVAIQEEFTKPVISESKKLCFKGLWHPLIKANLTDNFTPHDLELNDQNYFALITGPNMAGKTTVMREVAMAQFLTQLGSFVPAAEAKLSVCDFLFSRLGANDDIQKGQSTFMVEMSETAEILRHATDQSMIILDEIGRGTSTHDGLSIAWALAEYLIKKLKAFTLFSTHYHELIDLIDNLQGSKNFTVKTTNKNDQVQFLYQLIQEGATQSFGIYVAKMAGLPQEILARASSLLKELESHNTGKVPKYNNTQLDLFQPYQMTTETSPYLMEIEELLHKVDPVHMTPFQALETIKELKSKLENH